MSKSTRVIFPNKYRKMRFFVLLLVLMAMGCAETPHEIPSGLFEGFIEDEDGQQYSIYLHFDTEATSTVSIPFKEVDAHPFSSIQVDSNGFRAELGFKPVQLVFKAQWDSSGKMLEGSFTTHADSCDLDSKRAEFKLARSGSEVANGFVRSRLSSLLTSSPKFFPRSFECLSEEHHQIEVNERYADNDFWRPRKPLPTEVNISALEDHLNLCIESEADGCLVAHRGRIIQEWYGPHYQNGIANMSSMKSWTNILVGMLIDDGKIDSVEDPVAKYIPEWKAGVEAGVTIEHLLTMTSGLLRFTEPSRGVFNHLNDANEYVTSLELEQSPGNTWSYSNEGVQLLSPILSRAAGMPVSDYAESRLFGPLGMVNTYLKNDDKGSALTYADARTTLRDMARIAEFMRLNGQWEGQQLLSKEWIKSSTEARANSLNLSYGYLWWIIPEIDGYASLGYLDNNSYILPKDELVIVRVQNSGSVEASPFYRKNVINIIKRIGIRSP